MPQNIVDRATAARINPIISDVSQKDTLSACAELMRAIGCAAAAGDQSVCAQIFRLADAVAAAVDFEAEAV
jgi:hypothetical protein